MRGFPSTRHAQRFLSIFRMISDLFSVGRHLQSAGSYRVALGQSFTEWQKITGEAAIA